MSPGSCDAGGTSAEGGVGFEVGSSEPGGVVVTGVSLLVNGDETYRPGDVAPRHGLPSLRGERELGTLSAASLARTALNLGES
ncbi:hypothetical protein LLS1_32950 [Leifsonia sp. LS1]|nr:hypothetical protein LLS1_32950 [Leifsonia sp. LS1]